MYCMYIFMIASWRVVNIVVDINCAGNESCTEYSVISLMIWTYLWRMFWYAIKKRIENEKKIKDRTDWITQCEMCEMKLKRNDIVKDKYHNSGEDTLNFEQFTLPSRSVWNYKVPANDEDSIPSTEYSKEENNQGKQNLINPPHQKEKKRVWCPLPCLKCQ